RTRQGTNRFDRAPLRRQCGGTSGTDGEMLVETAPLVGGEGAVDRRREEPLQVLAGHHASPIEVAGAASRSTEASMVRARLRRDLTVPSGTRRASAISS